MLKQFHLSFSCIDCFALIMNGQSPFALNLQNNLTLVLGSELAEESKEACPSTTRISHSRRTTLLFITNVYVACKTSSF